MSMFIGMRTASMDQVVGNLKPTEFDIQNQRTLFRDPGVVHRAALKQCSTLARDDPHIPKGTFVVQSIAGSTLLHYRLVEDEPAVKKVLVEGEEYPFGGLFQFERKLTVAPTTGDKFKYKVTMNVEESLEYFNSKVSEKLGFEVIDVQGQEGYGYFPVRRNRVVKQVGFFFIRPVYLSGRLRVLDKEKFAHGIVRPIGRHSGYGVGMMLIRA